MFLEGQTFHENIGFLFFGSYLLDDDTLAFTHTRTEVMVLDGNVFGPWRNLWRDRQGNSSIVVFKDSGV